MFYFMLTDNGSIFMQKLLYMMSVLGTFTWNKLSACNMNLWQ